MPHGCPTSERHHGHKADLALPPELEYQRQHGNGDQDGDGSRWPSELLTTLNRQETDMDRVAGE